MTTATHIDNPQATTAVPVTQAHTQALTLISAILSQIHKADDSAPTTDPEFVSLYLELGATSDEMKEQIADTTLEELIAQINSRDQEARRTAIFFIEALGIAARPAWPALVEALNDPDQFTRCLAIDALPSLGCPQAALPALRRALLRQSDEMSLAVGIRTAFRLGRMAGLGAS